MASGEPIEHRQVRHFHHPFHLDRLEIIIVTFVLSVRAPGSLNCFNGNGTFRINCSQRSPPPYRGGSLGAGPGSSPGGGAAPAPASAAFPPSVLPGCPGTPLPGASTPPRCAAASRCTTARAAPAPAPPPAGSSAPPRP